MSRSRRVAGLVAPFAIVATIMAVAVSPVSAAPAAKEKCTIVGTSLADYLVGTSGRDVICGLGGADVIRGLGGNDVILGGRGHDLLIGGSGRDSIFGGRGNDELTPGIGAQVFEYRIVNDSRDFLNVRVAGGEGCVLGGDFSRPLAPLSSFGTAVRIDGTCDKSAPIRVSAVGLDCTLSTDEQICQGKFFARYTLRPDGITVALSAGATGG